MNQNQHPRDCPGCGAKMALIAVKDPDAGTLCLKCGWLKKDLKDAQHDILCGNCGKDLGKAHLLEGERPGSYGCPQCAELKRANGFPPDSTILVRHPSLCMGDCQKMIATIDLPQGKTPGPDELRIGFCDVCAPKLKRKDRDVAKNLKATEEIISLLMTERGADGVVTVADLQRIFGGVQGATGLQGADHG